MTVIAPADERVVVELWERQSFPTAPLRRLGLRVIFRGHPCDSGGPDYHQVVLASDGGTLLRGDVEFHVTAADWYRHGHHRNPKYNGVILHVVWRGEQETVTEDGRVVPTLRVGEGSLLRTAVTCTAPLTPHPCVEALMRLPDAEMAAAVRRCGMERLRAKADRIGAEFEVVGRDQALYAGVLEALGYASNRVPFRKLADAAPYGWVMSLGSSERAAALLNAGGFWCAVPFSVPVRLPIDSWRLARIRPGNDPRLRIGGAAALLERFSPSISETVHDAVERARSPQELIEFFTVRMEGETPIGPGRAREIVASVALPFAVACGGERSAVALYERLPAPPATHWTRRMLSLLEQSGSAFRVRGALEHQGLHHMYLEYCRSEGAPRCQVCGERSGDAGQRFHVVPVTAHF